MKYTMTEPCDQCPFLNQVNPGFTDERLNEFARGEFPCHKTASLSKQDKFIPNNKSIHCAGALIFLEKRNAPNQMMRIVERLGMYDHTKLKMDSDVR